MAVNKIYASTESLHRERVVPSGTLAGTPLLIETRPAVTLTNRGDVTVTVTTGILPDGATSVTYTNGGATNDADKATVAFDGTWEFAVAGATTSTGNGVEVFITSGGSLTTTVGTNTHYGWTDYPKDYVKTAGRAPVRIGK